MRRAGAPFIFFGHVRNRSPPVRTAARPFPLSPTADPDAAPRASVGPPRSEDRRAGRPAAYRARYQLVLRSRCTMTALRTLVGVCGRYVKVSGLHVVFCFFFSHAKIAVTSTSANPIPGQSRLISVEPLPILFCRTICDGKRSTEIVRHAGVCVRRVRKSLKTDKRTFA